MSAGDEFALYRKYLNEAFKRPLLTREREKALSDGWRYYGHHESKQMLTSAHERQVAAMVSAFGRFGFPLSDLFQEGALGLESAARNYNPGKFGTRFATLAQSHVEARIKDYIFRYRSMVRLTLSTEKKNLFFKLQRERAKDPDLSQGALNKEEVTRMAEKLGASAEILREVASWSNARDSSLDSGGQSGREDDDAASWLAAIPDPGATPDEIAGDAQESELATRAVRALLSTLPERSAHILVQRRLKEIPSTLEELGEEFGISKERVRQIENKALLQLKKSLLANPEFVDEDGNLGRLSDCLDAFGTYSAGSADPGPAAGKRNSGAASGAYSALSL